MRNGLMRKVTRNHRTEPDGPDTISFVEWTEVIPEVVCLSKKKK